MPVASQSAHPVTRSGPLFHVPDGIPSVRVRSDSDSEISIMESRRPPPVYEEEDDEEDFAAPGLVEQHTRELTLSTKLLIAGVIVAMILLISHEASIAFHLPWLDPRNVVLRLLKLRRR